MIDDMDNQRTRALNDRPVLKDKTCVLYVMARDQRVHDNHALSAAQELAIGLKVPLAVIFCLQPKTGYRAREHYEFMLSGLDQVETVLADHSIPLMIMIGNASERLRGVLHHLKPAAVYFDFNPLRGPQALHRKIAQEASCAIYEVDAHNVVPVWQASDKQEIGARTLRPKINRLLAGCVAAEAAPVRKHPHAWPGPVKTMEQLQTQIRELLEGICRNGSDITRFYQKGTAGEATAESALKDFLSNRLKGYATNRNDPGLDAQSELNPYLHYGQLAGAKVVRAVEAVAHKYPSLRADANAFIEELVIRRELSDNYCFYNTNYDKLTGAPDWAQKSLAKHAGDPREYVYSRKQFESAVTHDSAWNASQRQLIQSGKIHGYMRMYWAKKVLEWSASPQDALDTLLYLNDFYHIDGGDPNGYVGILWSIAGLHDRPWGERPIYGVVRSMVYTGLKRKFNIVTYENQWPAT